jgi:hypothetical protein
VRLASDVFSSELERCDGRGSPLQYGLLAHVACLLIAHAHTPRPPVSLPPLPTQTNLFSAMLGVGAQILAMALAIFAMALVRQGGHSRGHACRGVSQQTVLS